MSFKSLPITLDQIHILDTIVLEGSLTKASKRLHRAHSALLYAIKNLEDSLGIKVFDRSGYRLTLTPFGSQFLEKARVMLRLEDELRALSTIAKSGWEPELKIIYDGILDPEPLLKAAHKVRVTNANTRLSLFNEYLSGVTQRFSDENAAAMVSVLPAHSAFKEEIKLPRLQSWLVAHKDHELTKGKVTAEMLQRFPFLTVRGSDKRLQMSTSALEQSTTIQIGDFNTKKTAILRKYGYGWMPEFLIENELEKKTVRPIKWERDSLHVYQPIMYINSTALEGKAMQLFRKTYVEILEKM